MKLIEKKVRKGIYGRHPVWFGLFECPFCGLQKEYTMSNGRKNLSCGCRRGHRGPGRQNKCGSLAACKLFFDVIASRLIPENQEEYMACGIAAVKVWHDHADHLHTMSVSVDRLYKRAA